MALYQPLLQGSSTQRQLSNTSEKNLSPPTLPNEESTRLLSALKLALLLVVATTYVTFCYVVHFHIVPIQEIQESIGGISSLAHFSTKAGVTTLSIIIINIGLWPVRSLIDEIRSEEFFRLLCTRRNGVPLNSVNAISNPTTGVYDIAKATFRRHCSAFLASTILVAFLIVATSALAPAALNVEKISLYTNASFVVGAVPPLSVVNTTSWPTEGYDSVNTIVLDQCPYASALSWVENTLNITNTYTVISSTESDASASLVPFPPDYTATMQRQWLTDVIVLNPSCSWQPTSPTGRIRRITSYFVMNVTLPQANLRVVLSNYDLDLLGDAKITIRQAGLTILNHSTWLPPSDGSIVFVLTQGDFLGGQSMNLSGIPTLKLTHGVVNTSVAFLLCSPRASIQTRHVWSIGNGTIMLGKRRYRPHGNLDPEQTNFLLSFALSSFSDSSGPPSYWFGTEMQARLIFGQVPDPYINIAPSSLTSITAAYKSVIRSTAKTFLSGVVGTANVPGGILYHQLVFTSSLGHVIASTFLFATLTVAFVAAQFRKGRGAFTLVEVAAAVADSDVPKKCAEMKQREVGVERTIVERKMLELVTNDDGTLVCICKLGD